MDLRRRTVTRTTARLTDPAQEARFRRYNLLGQRRGLMAALTVVVLASLASFLVALVGGQGAGYGSARVLIQVVTVASGAVMFGVLHHTRSPRVIERAAAVIIGLMSVLIAGMVTVGPELAVQGPLLVAAGVVLVYLIAPFGLVGTTAMGLLYSAVTVPAWLLAGDIGSAGAVRYTLFGVLLAHGLAFLTTRRLLTERRLLFAERERLEELATIDPLTGIANRRVLDRILPETWREAHRQGRPLSMLMLDIDYFKSFNDAYGHLAGDHALRSVAEVIARALPGRPGDLAARYGGEEFVVLLPGSDKVAAAGIAESIRDEVAGLRIAHRAARGEHIVLTVSAGVAQAEPGMGRPDELVRAADRDLYRAKAARTGAAGASCAGGCDGGFAATAGVPA